MPITFRAVVTFLSAAQGGRSNPPASGYRPPVWFHQIDASGEPVMWDFVFDFPSSGEEEPVPFGEQVPTVMKAVSATNDDVDVSDGATFEVREGARVVGRGRVEEILSE